MSLQSIIWVFLLNNFSCVINLLLTKLARDRPGRISALGLFCTNLAALGPYCQNLGPIFSQCGPRAWLIRYIYQAVSYFKGCLNSQLDKNETKGFRATLKLYCKSFERLKLSNGFIFGHYFCPKLKSSEIFCK